LEIRAPSRVHDLHGCDVAALCRQLAAEDGALIACGGDGTASHALDCAWQVAQSNGTAPVPVGIIPLGTGNDLARSLGWGGSAPTAAALDRMLARLVAAPIRHLDRWELTGPNLTRTWFNYWSLGIDARVALGFHHLRDRHPYLFRLQALNLALYATIGLGQVPPRLDQRIGNLSLPVWTRGLVICNIASWAGGVRLHPGIRADDGHADAFALAAGIPLGLATGRVRQPLRLGTRREWTIDLRQPTSMQCDGEPFVARSGRYRAHCHGQALVLINDVAENSAQPACPAD
jgi:diacylglycerol kinase (ATP)